MTGKQIRNRLFIVFGLLLAVTLTISAVVGYVYWESPSKEIPAGVKNEVAKKTYRLFGDTSTAVVNKDARLSPSVGADTSVRRTDGESAAEEENMDVPHYASVPDSGSSWNTSAQSVGTGRGLRNPMLWNSRNVLPPHQPLVKKGGSSSSGVSTFTRNQTDTDSSVRDVIEGNSSGPVEGANNNPYDTPVLTDNGKTEPDTKPGDTVGKGDNYSVSVSRSIHAGKVVLTVAVADNPPNGLIIHEIIPAGWQMTSASPAPLNCWSFPCSGTMKWLFITQYVGSNITYTIERNGDAAESAISGNYLFKDPAAGPLTMTTKGANGV